MNASIGSDLAQALFHQSGDALFLFDPATECVVDANVMALRLTGLPRADLLRLHAHELFQLIEKGDARAAHAAAQRGVYLPNDGYYLRTRQPDVWVPVLVTIAQLNVSPTPLGLITARDLRARREAHAELVRKETELHRLLTASSDCFWHALIRARGDWMVQSFSPVVQQVTGYPEKYFLPGLYRWWHIVYPADRPRCEQVVLRLRAGMPSQAVYRIVAPDGSIRWLRDQVQVQRSADGKCLELHGRMTDITERKRAEEAVRLRDAVLHALPDAVFVIDAARPGQPIVYANSVLESLTGRAHSAILERSWRAVLGVDAESAGLVELDQALRERRPGVATLTVAVADGTRSSCTVSLRPLDDRQRKPTYFVGVVTDSRGLASTEAPAAISAPVVQASPLMIDTLAPDTDCKEEVAMGPGGEDTTDADSQSAVL